MLPLPPGGAAHLFFLAAVAALVGGLSAIERKGALQLMLSRPIVLAPILGWALGDARGGLVLGVPLELLFLGGVNLGGSLPDNESLLAGALTAMVVPAGIAAGTGVDAPLAALGLALLLPLALFGRRLDRAAEELNSRLMDEAVRRASRGDPSAARVNLRGLLLPFGAAAGICALGVLVSPVLALARAKCRAIELFALAESWHLGWAVAAACAVRAIRDPRAPALAAVCALTVIVITLAFRGPG
ncbi:MAG: PTS sugar transporter subunit IIC [Deltaproteobacteria bacterium]|nr:MAG: PTS sugar transporter subunit IIC [Deltaproteobacteria bacterium]TMA76128.1 MAG: PTS sugar transporter subunit IIC [Deltaproteobacteria bacterium]TMB32160.1 MAG: PTS sugar transporter subunit IIC [Deltaproteobacteria bacterium]